jgi:D-aminoacyl-tRNA deacylase
VKLIVTSSEDPASMNIRARLLERPGWREEGAFGGHAVLRREDFAMIQVDRIHLDEDFVDERAASALGESVDTVIFASRHKAESRIPTLTVHPIGNYSSADFGGRPGTLCRTSPHLMASALRILSSRAQGLGFNVSFETTHHGPVVSAPAFYIEIGSHEELWGREDAAEAIAETILTVKSDDYPVLLCIGGGHYAPRFTEVALTRKVAIGHMAANYALEALDDDMIAQMSGKSEGCRKVYFHRKGMPKSAYRRLKERVMSLGYDEVSSEDFDLMR